MSAKRCILFTAFELSGDEHAAPVIREVRSLLPDVPIYALGGPKMREAGATLIEETTSRAVMGGGAIGKVFEHRAIRGRLRRWLAEHPVAVHVPTDSPAANWGICRMTKERGARVVHLVAPQVWAWASWRVRRLRKWSDLVLCILPFEPQWFARHGIKARFIGHPLFDEVLDVQELEAQMSSLDEPDRHPRIALLPGSRSAEIRRNMPLMRTIVDRLTARFPRAFPMIAVADDAAAREAEALSIPMVVGMTEAVLHWADVVLVTSGTATLHVTRHGKPMAIVYRVSSWSWHLIGRWLMRTRTFTLPNLIAAGGPTSDTDGHIVREFTPFIGGPDDVGPIVDELTSLIEDREKYRRQAEGLLRMVDQFHGHNAGREAAQAICECLENSTGPVAG